MKVKKAILLAGGAGTRLHPLTITVNKHLLPIYDKPIIFYSLCTLILAGIQNILIISTPKSLPEYQKLFGDGSNLGLSIQYGIQEHPNGIAQAPVLAENFIGNDDFILMLGDNILIGDRIGHVLAQTDPGSNCVYCYNVADPSSFGIATFDKFGKLINIEEKPQKPNSNWALIGIYKYRSDVVDICKEIRPSTRGEYEISDVNKTLLQDQTLNHKLLGRGYSWFDGGSYEGLHNASVLVKAIQETQGLLLGSPEEASYRVGNITKTELETLCNNQNSLYYKRLRQSLHR